MTSPLPAFWLAPVIGTIELRAYAAGNWGLPGACSDNMCKFDINTAWRHSRGPPLARAPPHCPSGVSDLIEISLGEVVTTRQSTGEIRTRA